MDSAVVTFEVRIKSYCWCELEDGVYFGAAWGEVCGGESDEDEGEFGPGEVVVVVVEEDAYGDVEEDADDDGHDEALEHLVFGNEVEVAEGAKGCHDGKEREECEAFPEVVAVVHEEADEDKCDGYVVEDNAVEKSLVYVAVGVYHGHAFEEGVDAESDEESGDGVGGVVVAVAEVV